MRYFLLGLILLLSTSTHAVTQLAVVVSQQSPIAKMDAQALQAVFLGLLTQNPELRNLKPVDLMTGETRDFFYQNLVGRNRHQMQSYWSRMTFTGRGTPPAEVTDEQIIEELKKNPTLIAYVPVESVGKDVRILMLIP